MFCYYFGPRVPCLCDIDLSIDRMPKDRILFARTGDEALRLGRWVLLSCMLEFDPDLWTMPRFRFKVGVGGGPNWNRSYGFVSYDENLRPVAMDTTPVVVDDLWQNPLDSASGYLAMELGVEQALRGELW